MCPQDNTTAGVCDSGVCCIPYAGLYFSLCQDGVPDDGEQCQPTQTSGGDNSTCCSQYCRVQSVGVVCRAAAGPCDSPELCDGGTFYDQFHRMITCPKVSSTCPSDFFFGMETVCQEPQPGKLCDAPHVCDGADAACPPLFQQQVFMCVVMIAFGFNARKSSQGVICRNATSTCDEAEKCTGSSALCPDDVAMPFGTPCISPVHCYDPQVCVCVCVCVEMCTM
jgi:hypothetical protein